MQKTYAGLTFLLLRRHGVHLSYLLRTESNVKVAQARAEALLALLPPLWKYAWKKGFMEQDTPLRFSRATEEVEDLPIALLLTLDTMLHLHLEIR